MLYAILKAALSGIIILAASEIARRAPTYGALIVSLPLVAILSMIWLWRETGDSGRVAALSTGTFWLVLPTLPMFLVLPLLLRHGVAFWSALAASSLMTILLYLAMLWLLPRLGVSL